MINKEDYDKLSTYSKIEFDIDMMMYMIHNDKIASIYDNLGDMYGYKDLEEAKALEEHDTFIEYKKALKEKCDAIDKAIEYIEEHKRNVYDTFGEGIVFGEMDGIKEILKILRGEDNESN